MIKCRTSAMNCAKCKLSVFEPCAENIIYTAFDGFLHMDPCDMGSIYINSKHLVLTVVY